MRTTVNIDDDVLREAKELARLSGMGLGPMLSHLVRRGLSRDEAPRIVEENGIPVLAHRGHPIPVTPELVRQLRDETEPDVA